MVYGPRAEPYDPWEIKWLREDDEGRASLSGPHCVSGLTCAFMAWALWCGSMGREECVRPGGDPWLCGLLSPPPPSLQRAQISGSRALPGGEGREGILGRPGSLCKLNTVIAGRSLAFFIERCRRSNCLCAEEARMYDGHGVQWRLPRPWWLLDPLVGTYPATLDVTVAME